VYSHVVIFFPLLQVVLVATVFFAGSVGMLMTGAIVNIGHDVLRVAVLVVVLGLVSQNMVPPDFTVRGPFLVQQGQ